MAAIKAVFYVFKKITIIWEINIVVTYNMSSHTILLGIQFFTFQIRKRANLGYFPGQIKPKNVNNFHFWSGRMPKYLEDKYVNKYSLT